MNWLKKLAKIFLGAEKNPFHRETRKAVALVAFIAWIGLGSDGLSSANYGPEEAFRALGHYPMLGLFLALAIGISVFIISGAYNQVIELFPNGGGGYKVANRLLHPIAGLVSGSALIIDYMLTIAISVAAAADALFSLLPASDLNYDFYIKFVFVLLLTYLNLRGMKESIKILMPIFLGFVLTHLALIIYGFAVHGAMLPGLLKHSITQTAHITQTMGIAFVLTLLLKAYSLGGGTFTGLEAVSNNVNVLAEPRVKTGRWTMFYMAVSLSLTATGILLLYMLWGVHAEGTQTFNAILFGKMLQGAPMGHAMLIVVLAFEAGILFLGANTGFLGGPAVLANMASDRWVPRQFANLSSRLVKQNGVIVFGIGAMIIMLLTHGHVAFLVILYSANVFLTFSITLFGLCKYWITHRQQAKWFRKFLLAAIGTIICASILMVLLVEKFTAGGWLALIITGLLIFTCYKTKKYYHRYEKRLLGVGEVLVPKQIKPVDEVKILDPQAPTAVIFVNQNKTVGIHTMLWIERLFPQRYKNIVFVQVGVVDVSSYSGEADLKLMQAEVNTNLQFFVKYAQSLGYAATAEAGFATSPLQKLPEMAADIASHYPHCVFFAGKVIFASDNPLTRFLNSQLGTSLQNKLHFDGYQMILLPMRLAWA